jgi:salicylate hydroxylase
VAIIGAGIGGLSLGLALRERGLRADVFEQASELAEIGAAIALSANALREYARLGLVDELAAASTVPTELIYRHWRDGHRIAAEPVAKDTAYVERFGAPYFGIHRADLQKTLSTAFGVENVHLGCRLVNLVAQSGSVVLEFANGRIEHADVVVGADGVRSTVRRWVTGADDALYSGTSAFRGIVPVANLPSLPDPQAIQFWMGPDAHLLHYAIGGHGESVNFFAVVNTPRIWLPEASVVDVATSAGGFFPGWHPAVTEMMSTQPIRWALFGTSLLHWYRGRVVILGDAARDAATTGRVPALDRGRLRTGGLLTRNRTITGIRPVQVLQRAPANSTRLLGRSGLLHCLTDRRRKRAMRRWPSSSGLRVDSQYDVPGVASAGVAPAAAA